MSDQPESLYVSAKEAGIQVRQTPLTPSERKLQVMLDAAGFYEQGSDDARILYDICLSLLDNAEAAPAVSYSADQWWVEELDTITGTKVGLTLDQYRAVEVARQFIKSMPPAPSQRVTDDVFEALELDPESFRTEGGAVNAGKLKAAILHPYNYLPPDHWLQARFAKPGGRPLSTDQSTLTEDKIDAVGIALRRAWQLGQTYWQQADSDFLSQQKKSDETQRKFEKLCDDIITALREKQEGGNA